MISAARPPKPQPREYAGLRCSRWDAARETWVCLYDGEAAMLDTDGGRWQTVCERHGGICSHLTLEVARGWYHADPAEWCEECRP